MVKRKEKVIWEISRSSQPTYRPVQLHFKSPFLSVHCPCLTGLKSSLASLKIICLSYSTVRCNDNVFSPTINDRNQHAIQLSCFYFLTFILTSQNSLEHSAVLKKRAIELLNNKSTRFDYK